MRELQIFVPILPPVKLSPNKGSGLWFTKMKEKNNYSNAVRLCAVNARNLWSRKFGEWQPLKKATLQLIFTWPLNKSGPMPDKDNLMAAFKSGIDALTARPRGHEVVGAGIIEDDGPGNITWYPLLLARGEDPGVRIIVQEVGE